jgi:DNA helicase-2/ATP-dependent DNA helicase PcrA
VDLRGDEARWAWAELAVGAGATADPLGTADVVLPDGRPAWCDGGPLQRFAPEAVEGAAVLPWLTLERRGLQPLGTGPVDAELAPDQLAAVAHPGGTARIIAPAGSGKTRVLTERARHLLAQWNLPPSALCVVAFNERAAAEVRARTADLPGLQVRTLNALGLAILDGRAPFAPRAGGRHAVVDERMQRELLGQLVEVPRRANTDPMAPWLDALSEVRLRLRSPSVVEADYGGDVDGLPGVVERYRAMLRDRHAVDFDEQIATAVEVLLTEPGVRAAAQRACRVLLVDEFQDLAPAHLLLVRLLASPDLAVFGVGDDDQTIYGFSGATPRWLVDYDELFPGAGDHPLEVNYRCPEPVVQGVVALLARNQVRVTKTIRAAPGREGSDGEGLTIVTADEAKGETIRATVAAVQAALDAGAAPNEIAVLTRVNASLAAPQVALRHHRIPVERALDERALDRTGTRAALAWLRLAANPGRFRPEDVREAARRPPGGRSGKLLDWMAEQRTVPALRALADRLQGRDSEKVASFVAPRRRRQCGHRDAAASRARPRSGRLHVRARRLPAHAQAVGPPRRPRCPHRARHPLPGPRRVPGMVASGTSS